MSCMRALGLLTPAANVLTVELQPGQPQSSNSCRPPTAHMLSQSRKPCLLQAFADVITRISSDRYLQPHIRYYVREVRVVAYSQVN